MILNKEAFNLALAQAELTKQEVAKKSGVAPSTITKLLSGNQEMQPRTAGKIAKALGCNVIEIIETEG